MRYLKIILITLLLNNYNGFAQTEFVVTYHRVNEKWGIDDFQKLEYKDGSALFSFFQKEEKKKINFYEIDSRYHKYRNFYNIKNKSIVEQNQLKDGTLLVANWKYTINWEILEDTKVINGYTVQKATTQPYDSEKINEEYGLVTAWFTTEIPINIGPLRYYNLPGLILELSFERYGATYKMTKIDFDTPIVIPTIENGIKVTKEQSIHPEEISKKWLKKQKATSKNNKSWWQLWD